MATLVKHSTRWSADYLSWHGGYVTTRDAEILDAIEEEVGAWWGPIHLMQGGLSTSVAASAHTHAGLGAFDVQTNGRRPDGETRSKADILRLASVFLRSGIVFFVRGQGLGLSSINDDPFRNNKHGHCVSRESYASLHPEAQAQYKEFKRYRAGLSNDGDGLRGVEPFPGPATPLERWATSPYNPANLTPDTSSYTVNVTTSLLGLDVDRHPIVQRGPGFEVVAAKRIERWGRSNVRTADGTYYALEFLTSTATEPANGLSPDSRGHRLEGVGRPS